MNNRLKKVLSLILAVALLCTLCACGEGSDNRSKKEKEEPTDEETIVGTWILEFDGTDAFISGFMKSLTSGLGEEEAEEIASYFDFGEFVTTYVIEFDEDGTYVVSVDEDALHDQFEDLKEILKDGLFNMYEDVLTEEGIDYTEDELLDVVDSIVEEMLSEETIDAMIDGFDWEDLEGQYLLDDGKISFSDDVDTEPDPEEYDTYELDDDTLTLKKCHRDADDEIKDQYPLELYRD